MATSFTVLKTPAGFPRWATNSGRVLEPSSGVKDVGWQIDDVPPARWMNWLQNLAYEWNQYTLRMQVSNWKYLDYTTTPSGSDSIIYHPDFGLWFILVTNGANGESWESLDGNNFTMVSSLTGHLPQKSSIAIDSTYVIVGSDDGLEYRNVAGTWASIAKATIGTTGSTAAVATKYDTSDLIVVFDNTNSQVYRETTGITGGSWAAATTQPPSPLTADVKRMIWGGGNYFYILTCATATPAVKTFVSSDNGDNWAATATIPLSSGLGYSIGHNPDSGRILVGGATGTTTTAIGAVRYSDDQGATWNSATIDFANLPSGDQDVSSIRSLYYCGNNVWVGAGSAPEGTGLQTVNAWILISTDDGETWAPGSAQGDVAVFSGANADVINQVGGSPYQLIGICDDGVWISLNNGSYNV